MLSSRYRECLHNKSLMLSAASVILLFLCCPRVEAGDKLIAEVITSSSDLPTIPCNSSLPCLDEYGSECVAGGSNGKQVCRCKAGYSKVIRSRFCFRSWPCSAGQYWEDFEKKCKKQQRADPQDLEANYCQFDYQCYGGNVSCLQFGFNRNCVCDAGFRYSSNGTCEPVNGIGGHCRKNDDCDASGFRQMICQQDGNRPGDGTCQCQPEHTYNFDIDGCESNEVIAERKRSMRSLIILFIIFGVIFGFALTFNFGILTPSAHRQNQFLMKRIAEEQNRYQNRFRPANQMEKIEEAADEDDTLTTPNAPEMDAKDQVKVTMPENTLSEGTQTPDINEEKLISLS